MRRLATSDRPSVIIAVLAFAGVTSALMHTLVVPLLVDLPDILHTSAGNASWVVTATLLSASVFSPVNGRLGDMYGKRRMLLICTIPLIAGSVACALASSLVPMLIGRILQGMGTGIIPLGISAMRDLLPADRLNSSIALMSSSLGVGSALGLPIAATVAEQTSWRMLFWGAAALNALMALLIALFIPTTPTQQSSRRFDFVGAFTLGIGLLSLLVALSKGSDWGWAGPTVIALLATAGISIAAWIWWELRTPDPMVDLRLTSRSDVLLTNLAGILVGFSLYAQSLVLPQLLRLPESTGFGLGQSMLAMGLWLMPSGLMMMTVSPLGGRLSNWRGPKFTLVCGCLVIAFGYASSLVLFDSTWGVACVAALCSAGVGLAYGALPSLILNAVPSSQTASANSFNTLMRAIGTTAASAAVGVILAHASTSTGDLTASTESAFRIAMLVGGCAAVAAALVAAAIPKRSTPAETDEPSSDDITDEATQPARTGS